MPKSSLTGRKRVKFQLRAKKGSKVYVAGSFNDWDPAKNRLIFRDGAYSASLLLPKGRYEYKFVVDDCWSVDPECSDWVPNSVGSLNSVVTVE